MDGDRCKWMPDLKGCKHLNKPVIFASRLAEFSLQDLRSQGQSCRLQTIPSKLDTTICSCSPLLRAEHYTRRAARLFFVFIDFWRLISPIFFFDRQHRWSKCFRIFTLGGGKTKKEWRAELPSTVYRVFWRTSSGGRSSPLLCMGFFFAPLFEQSSLRWSDPVGARRRPPPHAPGLWRTSSGARRLRG